MVILYSVYAYRALSPVLGTTVCCRFVISCSEYALQQFTRERWWRALLLSLRRFMQCHPF